MEDGSVNGKINKNKKSSSILNMPKKKVPTAKVIEILGDSSDYVCSPSSDEEDTKPKPVTRTRKRKVNEKVKIKEKVRSLEIGLYQIQKIAETFLHRFA